MSDIGYRKLLYDISETLDNSFNIQILRYMCKERISPENENRINNARELFDELEREGHLGIDNLDVLKEILRELEELGWLRVVIEFVMKRNELREPRAGKTAAGKVIGACKTAAGKVIGAGKTAAGKVIGAGKTAAGKVIRVIEMYGNFRTAAGVLTTINCVMILRRCNTLEEFIGAFNNAVLPTATTLLRIRQGSICFTVQAENLSALKALWDIYQDGTLQKRLQEFLVTEEIKKLADGKEVEVTVSIDEQEYKDACLDLKIAEMEASKNKKLPFTARRRNSDSSISLKDMETEAMRIQLNQSQKKLQLHLQLERERTRALEKENENLRAKLVATHSVGTQTTEPIMEDTVGVQNWILEDMGTRTINRLREFGLERKRTRDLEGAIYRFEEALLDRPKEQAFGKLFVEEVTELGKKIRVWGLSLGKQLEEEVAEIILKLVNSTAVLLQGKPITDLPTDPSQSITNVIDFESVEVGRKAAFTVQTKDSQGIKCYSEDDVVRVVVTAPTGLELEEKIESNGDGTYEVTYRPDCVGQHDVVVTVNGELLAGCPRRVQVTAPPRQYQAVPFTFGSKGTGQGQFDWPGDIAVSKRTGNIAVADRNNNRIQIFSPEGKYITEFGQEGPGAERQGYPHSVAFTLSGDVIVIYMSIVDESNKLSLFNESGEFIRQINNAQLINPFRVSVAIDGQLIVCDWGDKTIKVLSPDGTDLLQSFTAPDCSGNPTCAVCHQDKFFVSYSSINRVKVFSNGGLFLYNIGSQGSGNEELDSPDGLTINYVNHLIVCDMNNHRLKVLTMSGKYFTKIKAKTCKPRSVAVSNDGNIFVTDISNYCVHVFQ